MRPWIVLSASSAGLSIPSMGIAQPNDLPLTTIWYAPAECRPVQDFRDDVAKMAAVDNRRLPPLEARIVITRTAPAHYVLTLDTVLENGSGGTRTFHGQSCGAVFDAAAVTVALILNPDAQPSVESQLNGESKAVRVSPERVEEAASSRPTRLVALVNAGVQRGLLPNVGPELGLGVGIDFGVLSLWLLGRHGLSQNATVSPADSAGGRLWLLSASSHGCWDFLDHSPTVRLCAGFDLSQVRGRGIGVSIAQSGRMEWVSVTAGLMVDIPLTSTLSLHSSGFALAPLARPVAYLEGIGVVHRPAMPAERFQVGFLWTFP